MNSQIVTTGVRSRFSYRLLASLAMITLGITLLMNNGCDVVGAVAYHAQGPGDVEVKEAENNSLNDSRLAIFINAPVSIRQQFPNLNYSMTREINYRLVNGISVPHEETAEPTEVRSAGLQDAKIINAESIVKYQNSDIYWDTLTPSELGGKFKLQRLVWIELQEFSTHDPGNPMVKRGRLSAVVRVYNLESDTPDAAVYESLITNVYPKDQNIVDPEITNANIAGVLTERFADQAAGLFLTHSIWVPNR